MTSSKIQLAQVNIGEVFGPARIPEFQSLGGFVTFLLPKVLLLGGVMFFIVIIVTGVGIVFNAGGDPHATESRKNILTYAVIGLIIMFSAYWILQIINFITHGVMGDIF